MAPKAKVIEAPSEGLWRIGRSPDPLRCSDPPDPSLLDSPTAGNRFDSPTQDYRVCYFASTLDGCFGETLARFRPNLRLAAIAAEDGFMAIGEVPADWRHRRLAVRVTTATDEQYPAPRFLDVEAAATRAVLRGEIGELLAYYGYSVPSNAHSSSSSTDSVQRTSSSRSRLGRFPTPRVTTMPAIEAQMKFLGHLQGTSPLAAV